MALTITYRSQTYKTDNKFLAHIASRGGFVAGSIAFDNSYPTGGESFDLRGQFNGKDPYLVLFEANSGYVFQYDYTNRKVKAYYTSTSGGALVEVPNAADLSSLTDVRFVAFGYL